MDENGNQNDDSVWGAGAAYVFARDQGGVGAWGQVAMLVADDAAADDDDHRAGIDDRLPVGCTCRVGGEPPRTTSLLGHRRPRLGLQLAELLHIVVRGRPDGRIDHASNMAILPSTVLRFRWLRS